MTIQDLTVVIPARNEQESLKSVLPALFAWCQDIYEVIIVVDSASDSSFLITKDMELCDLRFKIIINSGKGISGALHTGTTHASTKYIGICMADEILPLLRVNDFVKMLRGGKSFVSATRYAKGGQRYGGSKLGHSLSWLANLVFRIYSGSKMTDATTGIKFYEKSIWPVIGKGIDYKGWAPALAMSNNVLRNSVSYGEVPITSVDRPTGGISSFSVSNWVPAYLKAFIKTR